MFSRLFTHLLDEGTFSTYHNSLLRAPNKQSPLDDRFKEGVVGMGGVGWGGAGRGGAPSDYSDSL